MYMKPVKKIQFRISPFIAMVLTHVLFSMLAATASGLGSFVNTLFSFLCVAQTGYEIYMCQKDDRREKFWIIYLVFLLLSIVVMSIAGPEHKGAWWEYIVLIVGMPAILACDVIYHFIPIYPLVAAAAVGTVGYLLFITIRRLRNKKARYEWHEKSR